MLFGLCYSLCVSLVLNRTYEGLKLISRLCVVVSLTVLNRTYEGLK